MYYELCRVADFPHITKESRDHVRQHYWDASLTDLQMLVRNEEIAEINEEAKKHYANPDAALAFFSQGKGQK